MFGLANSASAYVWESRKAMREHQSMTQSVGMTVSYPASIHNLLCDEDPLSDASSTWDNYLGGSSTPRRICAMPTAPRDPPPPVAEPSNTTYTPPGHHAQALANMQAHANELRAPPGQAPPPANLPPRPHSELKGGNPVGVARQWARGVHCNIFNEARMQLP